jgi:hypothetical protein
MTTDDKSSLERELIDHVRERLNSNPHHASWTKEQRLTYELGYLLGILLAWTRENPHMTHQLRQRLKIQD